MVKHIVLFQLKPEVAPQEKMQAMEAFRKGILALPAVIPSIQHIEVGFNVNPAEKYEIALYSEFQTLDDVKAYAVHPSHVGVDNALKPYVLSRVCTYYEI